MSGRGKGGKVRVFTWAVGNNSVLTVAGVDNRVSARAALSVTARFFATTSRVRRTLSLFAHRSIVLQVSPSPLSVVSLVVVVSSVSLP